MRFSEKLFHDPKFKSEFNEFLACIYRHDFLLNELNRQQVLHQDIKFIREKLRNNAFKSMLTQRPYIDFALQLSIHSVFVSAHILLSVIASCSSVFLAY